MARRQTVRIQGLKELEKALRTLPRATGKNVLKRALMKAAKPIEVAAEAAAPRLSGQLKKSIIIGTKLTRSQKSKHPKQSAVEVFVGAGGLPQAHMEEFGGPNNSPAPYMRPAFDTKKQAAANMIKTELATELEKTRKRLAKKTARLARKK